MSPRRQQTVLPPPSPTRSTPPSPAKDLLAAVWRESASSFRRGRVLVVAATTNLDVSRYFPELVKYKDAFGAEAPAGALQHHGGRRRALYIDAGWRRLWRHAGSQGSGFQPSDETRRNCRQPGAVCRLGSDAHRMIAGPSLRAEHYSDFGNTTTGKLAASSKLPPLACCCAVPPSTGFLRAQPAAALFLGPLHGLHQPATARRRAGPNGSKIRGAAGVPALKQEKSRNFTLGFTWKPTRSFEATVDAYQIKIKDRIVLSGRFDDSNYLALGAILQGLGVGQAQFFVNSVDTRTQGLDVTASHRSALGAGKLNTFLARST